MFRFAFGKTLLFGFFRDTDLSVHLKIQLGSKLQSIGNASNIPEKPGFVYRVLHHGENEIQFLRPTFLGLPCYEVYAQHAEALAIDRISTSYNVPALVLGRLRGSVVVKQLQDRGWVAEQRDGVLHRMGARVEEFEWHECLVGPPWDSLR